MMTTPSYLPPAQVLLRIFRRKTPAYISRSLLYHRVVVAESNTTAEMGYAGSAHRWQHTGNYPKKGPVDLFPETTRDAAIQAPYVRISTPDSGLLPAEPLELAMSRVRQGQEHLVQISRGNDDGVAICRIMTVSDLLKQRRDKERLQKEQKKSLKQSVPKQIELTWAIGPHDLEHKLAQLKGFIEDGKKVEIILASKKRQRKATIEEGRALLAKVREKIAEAGARETQTMQGGQVGKHTVLSIRKKDLE